jgi:hypothetical protein
MYTTTNPDDVIPCAKPGCEALTTVGEGTYIDGCGIICPGCEGPLPEAYLADPPW